MERRRDLITRGINTNAAMSRELEREEVSQTEQKWNA